MRIKVRKTEEKIAKSRSQNHRKQISTYIKAVFQYQSQWEIILAYDKVLSELAVISKKYKELAVY